MAFSKGKYIYIYMDIYPKSQSNKEVEAGLEARCVCTSLSINRTQQPPCRQQQAPFNPFHVLQH